MEKRKRKTVMKKLLFVLLFFLFIFVLFLIAETWRTATIQTTDTGTIQATPTPQESEQRILFRDITYHYAYFVVPDPSKLLLIPNFDTKSRASDLASAYHCTNAANGGFYDTNNKPLGVFIGRNYSQPSVSSGSLFNGFFGLSDSRAVISTSLPEGFSTVLQSGPILMKQNKEAPLRINNDEHARRTVVGITDENDIIFIVFYIQDSIYNGPLLADMPALLSEFTKTSGISLGDALNLDGGTASFFLMPTLKLPEVAAVGSLFCLVK